MHDGKIGLADAAFVVAVNILADPFIQKRLLQGRAGSAAEGIVKNLEGDILFSVQAVSHYHVIGQVGVVLLGFISVMG